MNKVRKTTSCRPVRRERLRRVFGELGRTGRFPNTTLNVEVLTMLYWALMFFIVAIVAAVFGFGGIAAGASQIAQVLFFIFLVLFIVSLIAGGMRRPVV
jgi:uncharacterized membrane protein YtjA (UPF0391 family)